MSTGKQLHWTQRVALVRHNLHCASRSGDFTFFKTLQAAAFIEGTNHVANVSDSLGGDADTILAAVDNLNVGLAYVHQDAFEKVYDSLKDRMRNENQREDKSRFFVDMAMQKNMADMVIDKITSSAMALISQLPEHVQDEVTKVWITGAAIVSDCMQIALLHMERLESTMDDFIRMEESWSTVKASVVCAVTDLKGVFHLMGTGIAQDSCKSARSSSIASAGAGMFRRISNAFTPELTASAPVSRTGSVTSQSTINSRNSSVAPIYRTPNYVRNSVSAGCPTSLPPNKTWEHIQHNLSTIPPTPAFEEHTDPFEISVLPVPEFSAAIPVVAMGRGRVSQAVMCLL